MIKRLYVVLAGAIILLGLVHSLATPKVSDPRTAVWFFGTGIAMMLTGTLNLLNRSYGAGAPGVRWVCVGSNVVMTGFALAAGRVTGGTPVEIVLVVGIFGGATLLSVWGSFQPDSDKWSNLGD